MTGARRLLLLLALTILLPGLLLAGFGARALIQEREVVTQQWRQRLDRAAAPAANDLTREIDQWIRAAARVARAPDSSDQTQLPDGLRRALGEPGVAAIRFETARGVRIWPGEVLAYRLGPADPSPPVKSEFLEIEPLEIQRKDYRQAVARYADLLPALRGDDRAWILHRLARASHHAGQPEQAARWLKALEQSGGLVQGLPADFVARFERLRFPKTESGTAEPARDMLRDLVAGRWILEEARYRYYVARLRQLTPAGFGTTGPDGLDEKMRRRELLTEAVLDPSAGQYELLRGSQRSDAVAAIVVDHRWLSEHLAAVILPAMTGAGFVATVRQKHHTAPAEVATALSDDLLVERSVLAGGLQWHVSVRPQDSAAVFAEIGNRQRTYLAMLVGVVALLGSGSFLTIRVVRREMEVARMKSDFVAAVSHEFRSPLTGIRQLAEMLVRGRVASEARRQEYYERISGESDRLSRIVENLLDFARMEGGRRQYRFDTVQASDWLAEAARSFSSHEVFRSHEIVTAIDDGLPAVRIDREALTTAIGNLIANAVKYSPVQKTVWLTAAAGTGGVVIRVRDQGVGIAAADLPHVFDRFYRGAPQGSAAVAGAGLGLSLVQHIVTAHGGQVRIESQRGSGTTVSIHLKGEH